MRVDQLVPFSFLHVPGNTLRPEQYDWHLWTLLSNVFSLNKSLILIQMPLQFVPKNAIDKKLSLIVLENVACKMSANYFWPPCINSSPLSAAYMCQWIGSPLVQIMACGRIILHQAIIKTNAGLLSIGPLGTNFSEILIQIQNFSFTKCIWRYRLWNGGHFVQWEMS